VHRVGAEGQFLAQRAAATVLAVSLHGFDFTSGLEPQIEISNCSFNFTGRQRCCLNALIERKENGMAEFGDIRGGASSAGYRRQFPRRRRP
jgi:hypothetical protein